MKNQPKAAAIAAALIASTASLAQTLSPVRPQYQFPSSPPQSGAAATQLGDSPAYFAPYVGLSAGYNDNLFLSNVNEKSSGFWIVSPGLKLDARSANSVLQASYEANFGRFTSSGDDDYIDQTLRSSADFIATREITGRVSYDYYRGHDPRGSTDRPFGNQPDRYKLSIPAAILSIGQAGAQGRLEFFGSDAFRRYLNNPETTFASNRDTKEFGGAFYWRVAPKTQLLAEARRTDQEYQDPGSLLSSREERYYLGATWEATALTTGTVKVGQLRKKFDTGSFPAFTGTSWEALITWMPRTYSKVDLFTYRQPTESTGQGSFILTVAVGAIWTHGWGNYLSTELNARFARDKYQQFSRTDDTTTLGAKVSYKWRRWLTFGAEYQYTNRDSSQASFDYDRNFFMVTAVGTM